MNKSAGLFIFDEPSSALDPVSGYKLSRLLFELTDKTVIVTSHRLSMASISDVIFVFGRGELVEQGTHDELIRKEGLCFGLFSKNANLTNT